MNSRPFILVRPLSQLLQATLLRQMRHHGWNMLLSDTVLHSGECDHVDHALLLSELRDVWQHYAQSPPPSLQPAARSARTVNTDMLTLDGHVTLPMLRRLLQGMQRYPPAHAAAADALEALLVDYVMQRVAGEHLTAEDINALWALAAQCRTWDAVGRLLASYPLQSTLSLQSDAQIDTVLGYVLRCPFTSPGDGAAAPPFTHPHKFVQEVIGATTAWEYVSHLLSPAVAADNKVLAGHAISTGLRLAEVTQHWPASLRLPLPSTSLHLPSLHALAAALVPLHNAGVVPAAVQEALASAVLHDLRRLYAEREVWGTVRLLLYGAAEITRATGTDPLPLLRQYHTTLLAQLLAPHGEGNGGPPLDQRTLLHLLLADALLQPGAAVAAEQLCRLLLAETAPLPFHRAAYFCLALEALRAQLGPSSTTYQQLLARVAAVLTEAAMRDAACGRIVSLLLLHAPTVCAEDIPRLGALCDQLLITHAADGFTRRQLDNLLDLKGDALQVDDRQRVAAAAHTLPVREKEEG